MFSGIITGNVPLPVPKMQVFDKISNHPDSRCQKETFKNRQVVVGFWLALGSGRR